MLWLGYKCKYPNRNTWKWVHVCMSSLQWRICAAHWLYTTFTTLCIVSVIDVCIFGHGVLVCTACSYCTLWWRFRWLNRLVVFPSFVATGAEHKQQCTSPHWSSSSGLKPKYFHTTDCDPLLGTNCWLASWLSTGVESWLWPGVSSSSISLALSLLLLPHAAVVLKLEIAPSALLSADARDVIHSRLV